MSKKVKSWFVFTGTSILAIGILNFLSEASKQIKDFLTLNKTIGPYSGKVLYGIIIGLLIAIIYYYRTKDSKIELKKWVIFLTVSVIISCLLVFTPFLDLILE